MSELKWLMLCVETALLLVSVGCALTEPGRWAQIPVLNRHCSVSSLAAPTPRATVTCTTHSVSLTISPCSSEVRVGQAITVKAQLRNEDCAMVGLPRYRLSWETGDGQYLEAATPLEVLHSRGLAKDDVDEAEFSLRALRAGKVAIYCNVSFEVHLGYPGPAYWSGANSGPCVLLVVQ